MDDIPSFTTLHSPYTHHWKEVETMLRTLLLFLTQKLRLSIDRNIPQSKDISAEEMTRNEEANKNRCGYRRQGLTIIEHERQYV